MPNPRIGIKIPLFSFTLGIVLKRGLFARFAPLGYGIEAILEALESCAKSVFAPIPTNANPPAKCSEFLRKSRPLLDLSLDSV